MAKIRVLQVFTIMNVGGAESMIMNYYRQIDKSKIQFDFLVHRKRKAAFDDEIESLGGKIYKLDAINPFFPNEYYTKLRAFFEEHNEYKIIHSHLNTLSFFPLKIAKEFNIPIRIAHAHTALESIKLRDFTSGIVHIRESLKKLVKFRLKNKIHTYATHSFSCGEKAGKWLFGNKDFVTMNNAIDSQKFIYDESIENAYRQEFDIDNKTVIGHVGRFNTPKNHMHLLKVFASIVQKKPDCVLVLIGDGELRLKIETEAERLNIKEKMLLLGFRSDIPQLLQMMDVFVFPSFFEGLPVTLIEAQAAGLRIVASDTITKEVLLTNDIEFISILTSPDIWAQNVLSKIPYKKKNNIDKILDADYDIISNTKKIESFYLENTL